MRLMLRMAAAGLLLCCALCMARWQSKADSSFHLPKSVTMSGLKNLTTGSVSVAEVSDYVFGNYQGDFTAPLHADFNPKIGKPAAWPKA